MGDAARLTAALFDRYRVERELGAGGMATVWLAHDLKHDRPVALKVLRPELGAVLGGERFLAEIRTTAKLQHPHILPLLDSGEAAGLLYYVMPYVTGETLRARLRRETQLGVEETLRIARALAGALDYAHAAGIVHRDLKPENILFQAHEPVLADFGIALAVKSAGGERLTETGLSLGTPQYMSPEQASGDRAVDVRSDVYALGCVVYEMLAGEPPHTGPTTAAVLLKVMTQAPVPLGVVRPGLPAHVEAAVTRALAKAPADRHESAGELAAAMAGTGTITPSLGSGIRDARSVVVLPFVDVAGSPGDESFTDGLTEELITDLSRLEGVHVVSSAASLRLKGTSKPLPAIAAELGARYAVLGRIRRSGATVRITAQLMDATEDRPIWADRFTGAMEELFEFQERVSGAVAAALRVQVVGRRRAPDPVIADLLRKARHYLREYGEDYHRRALACCDEALEHDAGCAPALALKGRILADWATGAFSGDAADALARARMAAQTAIGIDRDLADAHFALALVATYEWDFRRAERLFLEAIRIDPTLNAARFWYGLNLVCQAGRWEDARVQARLGLETDPLDPMLHILQVWIAHWSRSGAEAVAAARRAVELFPKWGLASYALGHALRGAGQLDEAITAYERAIRLDGPGVMFLGLLGAAQAAAGRREDAIDCLRNLEERSARGEPADVYQAYIWCALGETERALTCLERSVACGAPALVWTPLDPLLDRMASHPRFRAVVTAIGQGRPDRPANGPASREAEERGPAHAALAPLVLVVPFLPPGTSSEDDWFADGLTDEVIRHLSGVGSLRVVSRATAAHFRRTERRAREAGREVGADFVLAGVARRGGDTMRLTVELIEVASDTIRWSDRFDGPARNVFDVQEQLARQVVQAMALSLTPEESRRLAGDRPRSIEAYECYLRARQAISAFSEPRLDEAARGVQAGLAIAPDDPLLLATMGYIHWQRFNLSGKHLVAELDAADAMASRALAQDPDLPVACVVRALVIERRHSSREAIPWLRRAIARERSADALVWLAWFLAAEGSVEEATELAAEAARLDPISLFALVGVGLVAVQAGDFGRAVASLAAVRATGRDDPVAIIAGALVLPWAGDGAGALRAADAAVTAAPDGTIRQAARMMAAALRGDDRAFRALLTPDWEGIADEQLAWVTADMLALLGDRDGLCRWLGKAIERGYTNDRFLRQHDRFLRPYHGDPEVEALIDRARRVRLGEVAEPALASSPGAAGGLATPVQPANVPPGKSIVVLPFDNLSPDPNDAYLADGLTEELSADLSRVRALRVIARNSAVAVKQRTRDVREIARLVNVRYVLEGSVRRAGNALRITAQLIDGSTDAHVWAEKYQGTMDDVFAMQESVSRAIVGALQVALTPEESRHLADRPIPDRVAYECYLRARQEIYGYTIEHLARAGTLLDRALSLGGENGLLLACKGWVHAQRFNIRPDASREDLRLARSLASRALHADPGCALARMVVAWTAPFEAGSLRLAFQEYRRALELDPNNADIHAWLGFLYAVVARDAEATRLVNQAMALDPLSYLPSVLASWVEYQAGRFVAAGERVAAWIAPDRFEPIPVWCYCVFSLAPLGRLDELGQLAERAVAALPEEPLHRLLAFLSRGLQGDRAAAQAAHSPAFDVIERNSHAQFVLHLAQAYAVNGEINRAFTCLDRAVEMGYANHGFLALHDPLLASLRSDSRFAALLRRVNAEQDRMGDA